MPLRDFFPAGTAWKKRLLALATEEIQRRERAGVSRFREGWRKELRHFNSQSFYLTEEGLAFFYPMYAIAPPSEGIPVFLMPYDAGVKLEREQT